MSTGWITSKLSDLTTKVGSGATPLGGEAAYKPSGTPLIRSMNVVFFGFKRAGLVFIDGAQAAALGGATVEAGDVLLNITGASIGRVTLAPSDMAGARVNQHVCIVRPGEALDGRFLNAYLSSPKVQAMIWAYNAGTTRQALTKQQILGFEVPVPPLAEQRRIADKLDTVLARVDAVNDRLARVAPLLKRFRQSVLAAATSGKLTEEWRAGEPFAAAEKLLGEIGLVSGGLTKNSKREQHSLKRPYLRVANVYSNELRLGDVAEIGLTEVEFEKTRLLEGDLLIVEGNGSIDQIGRAAIWRGEINDCCHQNHLIRWRAASGVAPQYVHIWLTSPMGREQLVVSASSTTGLHTLSVSKVAGLRLPVPPVKEQTEIVRRVELLFGYADRLEARLKAAQAAADRLTPALLAKAFRGELVPQDPNDEPASELLRRLAESRAAAPVPRKRGRPARTDA